MKISAIGFGLIALTLSTPAHAGDWELPFKAETMDSDTRVYWGRTIHSDSGPQKHGYDLVVMKYKPVHVHHWKSYHGSNLNNKNHYAYGVPIYAMEAGTIIGCWRNAPENPKSGGTGVGYFHQEITRYEGNKSRIYGGGNGVWIQHADGSVAEYAHFQPGSLPSNLCPHNDELLPQVIKSPNIRHAWKHLRVPESQRKKVKRGQFLGRIGNAGTSSDPHLHIHRERDGSYGETWKSGTPVPMTYQSGLWKTYTPILGAYAGGWKSLAGQSIPSGEVLVWPSRSLMDDYLQLGLPAAKFGGTFEHLVDSGYWPVALDDYHASVVPLSNIAWRPREAPFLTFYRIGEADFIKELSNARNKGFEPVIVETSRPRFGGKTTFSMVLVKGAPKTYVEHKAAALSLPSRLNYIKSQGMTPIAVAPSVNGNQVTFAILARKQNLGTVEVKPAIPIAHYQAEYNKQTAAGRKPIYLNGYVTNSGEFVSAIFASRKFAQRVDIHGANAATVRSTLNKGILKRVWTQTITSPDGGSGLRFHASFWKQPKLTIKPHKFKKKLKRMPLPSPSPSRRKLPGK